MTLPERAVICRMNVWQASPASRIEAEHESKHVCVDNPVHQQVLKAASILNRLAGLAAVGELLDNLKAMLVGVFADVLLLNADGAVSVNYRMTIVRHSPSATGMSRVRGASGGGVVVPIVQGAVLVVSRPGISIESPTLITA